MHRTRHQTRSVPEPGGAQLTLCKIDRIAPRNLESKYENRNSRAAPAFRGAVNPEGTMPLYEYSCSACAHRFERIVKFSDAPLTICPQCGRETIEQLISAPAVQFKGSGWYVTDYARKSSPGSSFLRRRPSRKAARRALRPAKTVARTLARIPAAASIHLASSDKSASSGTHKAAPSSAGTSNSGGRRLQQRCRAAAARRTARTETASIAQARSVGFAPDMRL